MFQTMISADHSRGNHPSPVPTQISLPDGARQGSRIAGAGQIIQFFTGCGFAHYVAILSFENWGAESCPRFAVYEFGFWGADGAGEYQLCQDVASSLTWPGYVQNDRYVGVE